MTAAFYLTAFYLRAAPAVMTAELMRDFGLIRGGGMGSLWNWRSNWDCSGNRVTRGYGCKRPETYL